jgi:hypothetical protein
MFRDELRLIEERKPKESEQYVDTEEPLGMAIEISLIAVKPL